MQPIFEYFMFARLLSIKDGHIDLMGVPINFVSTSIFATLQKDLISSLGFEKGVETVYHAFKAGSYEYNRDFIKKQGFKDKRVTLDWQIKIVTFAGWGNLSVAAVDLANDSVVVKYDNSPFPFEYKKIHGKLDYKSNYPVDFITAGFTAGGVAANFGKDMDAFETKCVALGDPCCEITVGTPEKIKPARLALWKKLKLI